MSEIKDQNKTKSVSEREYEQDVFLEEDKNQLVDFYNLFLEWKIDDENQD